MIKSRVSKQVSPLSVVEEPLGCPARRALWTCLGEPEGLASRCLPAACHPGLLVALPDAGLPGHLSGHHPSRHPLRERSSGTASLSEHWGGQVCWVLSRALKAGQ